MCPVELDVREYWERRLEEHDDLEGVGWFGLGRSFNRWMYAVRAKSFGRAVRTHAGDRLSSMRVLDVGSGTGFYLDQWTRLGAGSITGSDLTEVAVERLRRRRPGIPTLQLDIGSAEPPTDGATYDAISAMDVLFHIVDEDAYRRAIANMAALLVPGGLLLFSENLLSDEAARAPSQVSRTREEIFGYLRESGLEPVEVTPMFWLMNSPVDTRRRALKVWWTLVSRAASLHDSVGFVVGAALYPVELLLIRTLPDGPSTRLVAARKR